MNKKPKTPRDINQLAASIVKQATEPDSKEPEPRSDKTPEQQAATILGRRGGLKGGKARAEKLTPEQRRDIAKSAARKRWSET